MEFTGFWYNPNIHGCAEYQSRLMTAGFLFQHLSRPLIIVDPDSADFLDGLTTAHKAGKRCEFCWNRRLEKTAQAARDSGFDAFTTTLLASRHQEHQRIKEIAEEISRRHKVVFLYRDFRTDDSREAKNLSRRLGLYHQNYCGCLFSEWEKYRRQNEPAQGN